VRPCPGCGTSNPESQKFCGECGARLPADASGEEQRKTVTILFSDVTGSTALGERLEPESLRRMLASFFDEARRVIESHGGTVEKFIGDAVMAVFGVPVVHEDDAVRALRAASELMAALAALNPTLERSYGATLQIRIGVNTGEVVTGTTERLATGDAVNVAARLEQLAAPGEIYVGEVTAQLAAAVAQLDPLEPATLKGKAEPVPIFRLVGLTGAARPVRATPLVGRDRQLELLRLAFDRSVADRACSLFTVLGSAGVGKSRLVAEFLDGLDATIVRGRCLSYGHGVGLLPAADVVRQLLSGQYAAESAALRDADPAIAGALSALVAGDVAVSSGVEIAWAFRRLLEHIAAHRPLVVVLDDLHWAEEPLFELIEHLVTFSRDAPILALVMARPELMERRPGWGGGALNASTVLLEPLAPGDTAALVETLAPNLSERAREKVMAAAGGNPLFAEEMVALVAASGVSDATDIAVPPTIQALLAARLDQLDPAELRALERGSIEGQSFHRGAVTALSPEDAELPQRLLNLVRKDLLRPDQPTLDRDEAFRFRHLLLRDAAYERLPKSTRAELHERFARWLDHRAADLPERDSLVGYHLEQAYYYRVGLGPLDDEIRALGAEAASRLQQAGRKQMQRYEPVGALTLLDRAHALRPDDAPDVSLELGIASLMLMSGRPAEAVARVAATAKAAEAAGDRIGFLQADLVHVGLNSHVSSAAWMPELQRRLDIAMPIFEAAGDEGALGWAWWVTAHLAHNDCRFGDGLEAAYKYVEYAERSDDIFLALFGLHVLAHTALGPTPIPQALEAFEELRGRALGVEPWINQFRVLLLAEIGEFEAADAAYQTAMIAYQERGMSLAEGISGQHAIELALAKGDIDRAISAGEASCALLESMGENAFLSTNAAMLARGYFIAGRYDEAEAWANRAIEAGDPDDRITHAISRMVRAQLAAVRGDEQTARQIIEDTLRSTARMQAPHLQGELAEDAATAFRLLGDRTAEERMLRQALALFTDKGATYYAYRVERALSELATED